MDELGADGLAAAARMDDLQDQVALSARAAAAATAAAAAAAAVKAVAACSRSTSMGSDAEELCAESVGAGDADCDGGAAQPQARVADSAASAYQAPSTSEAASAVGSVPARIHGPRCGASGKIARMLSKLRQPLLV
jgi:hypothetical protein